MKIDHNHIAAQKRHKRIMHWDDERKDGNSLIVSLVDGWNFGDYSEHVRGFDTVREAMDAVRYAQPCDCDDCKKGLCSTQINK